MCFWSNPPDDSPSRIFGNRWLCRNAWQNSQERLAVSACTLLDRAFHRNRKAAAVCAETVDDRNFLWKRAEKLEENQIVFICTNQRILRLHCAGCRDHPANCKSPNGSHDPCILNQSSHMKRPFLRVTRWLGTIPLEAQCTACPASAFKAHFSGHRPELTQCQRSLQAQFDEHVRKIHPESDAIPATP